MDQTLWLFGEVQEVSARAAFILYQRSKTMRLPPELQEAIEQEISPFDRSALGRASSELTQRYKSGRAPGPLHDPLLRAAYLAARMPATFAAVARVVDEIRLRSPQANFTTLLDLGSGPGTTLFAAAEAFPKLERATLLEADPDWIQIGRRLTLHHRYSSVREAQWLHQDLRTAPEFTTHDMVVLSYVLGELPESSRAALLKRALDAAREFLVVIEPGTVKGFSIINAVRSALISAGAGIVAPCPHREACPLAVSGDWCHFAQRVERSGMHRQVKSGSLSYEDEKFSYIVASPAPCSPSGGGRIVRHPQKHSGHVQLALCTSRGSEQITVARSQKAAYKAARHAQWGDLWQEN
jgi:ribosomal protein RSM22 (predicted rRNA methylase)